MSPAGVEHPEWCRDCGVEFDELWPGLVGWHLASVRAVEIGLGEQAEIAVGEFADPGGGEGPAVRLTVPYDVPLLSADDAERLAAALLDAAARLRAVTSGPSSRGADALTAHLAHLRLRGLSPATVDMREKVARYLVNSTGRDLLDIDGPALDRWQRGMAADGLAASTRLTYLGNARVLFKWLLAEEFIEKDPTRVLLSPKLPQRRPKPISEADLELAIAAAGEPIRTWLILASYAGLRRAEIAGLRREDVDVRAATITVVGKGDKERTVPAADVLLEALQPYLGGSGPLWPGTSPDVVGRHVGNHLHDLGIPASIHCGRHRFASQVYQQTRDIRLVQDLLGHNSPVTTAAYAAPDSSTAAAAINALGRIKP